MRYSSTEAGIRLSENSRIMFLLALVYLRWIIHMVKSAVDVLEDNSLCDLIEVVFGIL